VDRGFNFLYFFRGGRVSVSRQIYRGWVVSRVSGSYLVARREMTAIFRKIHRGPWRTERITRRQTTDDDLAGDGICRRRLRSGEWEQSRCNLDPHGHRQSRVIIDSTEEVSGTEAWGITGMGRAGSLGWGLADKIMDRGHGCLLYFNCAKTAHLLLS
jgi:hypothetical protein